MSKKQKQKTPKAKKVKTVFEYTPLKPGANFKLSKTSKRLMAMAKTKTERDNIKFVMIQAELKVAQRPMKQEKTEGDAE